MSFLLEGLDSDADGRHRHAISRYKRAVQIDPHNPYAYVALARYNLEVGQFERALESIDEAAMLLAAQGENSLQMDVHIAGLRGSTLIQLGRTSEGEAELARARRLSPAVWGDGVLDAHELR